MTVNFIYFTISFVLLYFNKRLPNFGFRFNKYIHLYLIQIMIVSLLFCNYGFNIKMSDEENTPPSKRARAANYTQQEKTLLLNILLDFKDILESKRTDAISWREKENTWNQVAGRFNALSPSGMYRPVASLKKAYDNIKKTTRKDVANEKASIRCTGGGKGHFQNDPVLDLALEVMNPKTIHGLKNTFDSDRQYVSASVEKSLPEQEIYTNNSLEEENTEHNLIHESSESAHVTEMETLIIQVENEESQSDVNWGDFTVKNLRRPVNPKLIPKTKPCQNEPNDSPCTPSQKKSTGQSENISWSARRRPITTTLSSSDIAKKYNQLADLKIELVQKELETFKAQVKVKENRDAMEFELRKYCLELDVKIKQAILEKIMTSSLDFLSFQK